MVHPFMATHLTVRAFLVLTGWLVIMVRASPAKAVPLDPARLLRVAIDAQLKADARGIRIVRQCPYGAWYLLRGAVPEILDVEAACVVLH